MHMEFIKEWSHRKWCCIAAHNDKDNFWFNSQYVVIQADMFYGSYSEEKQVQEQSVCSLNHLLNQLTRVL